MLVGYSTDTQKLAPYSSDWDATLERTSWENALFEYNL